MLFEVDTNYAFICGSKLARIHKADCHTAALAGCGGRVKCRCRGSGRVGEWAAEGLETYFI